MGPSDAIRTIHSNLCRCVVELRLSILHNTHKYQCATFLEISIELLCLITIMGAYIYILSLVHKSLYTCLLLEACTCGIHSLCRPLTSLDMPSTTTCAY